MVSNSTLYALLQTVHANQTQVIIPGLSQIIKMIAALTINLNTDASNIESKLADLGAKLDQILLQVTPPETGSFNPETAIISEIDP